MKIGKSEFAPEEIGKLLLIGGALFFAFKAWRGISLVTGAVGDTAGDAVESAYGKYLEVVHGKPEMTEAAKLGAAEYVNLGYAYYDADGFFKITPKGEAYIQTQRALGR